MKITIKLLSDLCTASGETYNSLVDTDVVYDTYGIPYIPAKRIKGCIREATLEMVEMGLVDEKQYHKIFGKEGNQRSAFSISNAYLKDYENIEKMLEILKVSKASELVSQQNVLSQYTNIRTQTAVDLETGVADKNSLRTVRVVRKGLVFEASCNVINSDDQKILEQAVSLVKHIGVSRTRGLGLVDMRLQNETGARKVSVEVDRKQLAEHNRLRYQIYLKSPLVCKSAQGNQAVTEDYIAGSKVLGIIAGALGKEKYQEIMAQREELIVSNAYITSENERCIPGKSSLQKKKDQSWDAEGKMHLWDMLYDEGKETTCGVQMTSAGITYMNSHGTKVSVRTEISYHHQRPADKAIGRATGNNDGSSFYQLCSISADQTFTGYIYANKQQTEMILDALEHIGNIRMGYGRSSEFGAVDFKIDKISECETENIKDVSIVHNAVITLVSDVILYNDSGALTTEIDVFIEYLRKAVQVDDLKLAENISPYLKFVTVGGYNVTWGRRKPILSALGKGSTFIIHSDVGFDIQTMQNVFIGERVSEGFGEIQAEVPGNERVTIRKHEDRTEADLAGLDTSEEIVQKLLLAEFERRMQSEVRYVLEENYKKYVQKAAEFNAAVSKLRVIYKDESTYQGMLKQISGIEKEDKNKLCSQIVEKVVPEQFMEKILQEMKKDYDMNLLIPWTEEQLYKKIYHAYITELKYFVKSTDRKEK